jgi:hypothetical protein
VARLLPRDWDGQRLLRFLAGLAMLALAFTFRVDGLPAASPVTSSSVSAEAAQTQPAQTQPAQTQPAQTEAADVEAAQTEAAQIEAAQTEATPIEARQISGSAQIVDFVPSTAVQSGQPGGNSAAIVDGILPGASGSRAPPRG